MEDKVIWEKSLMGEDIVAIERDGYKWYLNSRYSDDTVAEEFVKNVEKTNEFGIYVIMGLANGSYLRKLLEKYPENIYVIYEPNKEVYDRCKETTNYDNEKIVIENDFKVIEKIIPGVITYLNCKYTKFVVFPNYDKLYKYETVKLELVLQTEIQRAIMNKNTNIVFDGKMGKNYLENIIDAMNNNFIGELKSILEKYNNKPGIVVSAGPSLDKNIEELKEARNKAVIIATDTAVKTMVKHQIIPDIIVTIDAKKPEYLFDLEEIQGVPLVCSIYYNSGIRKIYNSQRFYSYSPESYIDELMEKNDKNTVITGGSVAHDVMMLFIDSGFENICFIGQDLAYPDGKIHADASIVGKTNIIKEDMKSREWKYFEVKGYDGGKVVTEHNMNIYRKWIEDVIRGRKNIHFYNATEGGAYIEGAENITLKNYIDTYCKSLEKMDIQKEIRELKPTFSEELRIEKLSSFLGLKEEKFDKVLKNISELKKKYEEFNKLNLNGKSGNQRFVKIVRQLIEGQKEIEEMPEMELTIYYNTREYYLLGNDILEKKETAYEENKDIYRHGIETLNIHEKAIKLFLEDYDKVVSEYKESGEYEKYFGD